MSLLFSTQLIGCEEVKQAFMQASRAHADYKRRSALLSLLSWRPQIAGYDSAEGTLTPESETPDPWLERIASSACIHRASARA
jgi:hypothetical protein